MINIYNQSHRFQAMGCHIGAWLEMEPALGKKLLCQVESIFKREEARLTRFCPESELMQLNRQPGLWVDVSQPLWEIVKRAIQLHTETGGHFDCTLLLALNQAGYRQDFKQMGVKAKSAAHFYPPNRLSTDFAPPSRNITPQPEFDFANRRIRLSPRAQIDLGGIAKGYTAQSACDFLNRIGPCLIDAGGDLVAGDAPLDWPGWPVAISGPRIASHLPHLQRREESKNQEESEIGRLWLKNQTLATSGIDYRRWQAGNQHRHHIIDPRTHLPAETDLLTVSIIDQDACRAEAWATATLVLGLEDGLQQLENQNLPALLIDQRQEIHMSTEMKARIQLSKEYR